MDVSVQVEGFVCCRLRVDRDARWGFQKVDRARICNGQYGYRLLILVLSVHGGFFTTTREGGFSIVRETSDQRAVKKNIKHAIQ